jgi:hypothetical protein
MQEGEVNRVYVSLISLEVIGFVEKFNGEYLVLRNCEKLIVRKQWGIPRSQIGKDNPCLFHAGIGRMADGSPVFTTTGFAGLIETFAMDVIKPTMIDTSQASVFHSSITQIGPTVGTVNS